MRLVFRGTRGSMAAPGPDTLRYGGNTTCLEVRSDRGDLIILDAGTGIRELGIELMADLPVTCPVFITHTHWDHIQGLPFFAPLFTSGNRVTIHGPPDPLNMTGIDAVLTRQMEYPYFPVREAELKADIVYETLSDGQSVDLGFARVSALLMNHPAMNFGYRVECDGRTLFFTGDHEPVYNIYAPGEPDFDDYERIVQARQAGMLAALEGVDLLVADAQYTEDEYAQRRGWGHSTYRQPLALARDAGVGRVCLTHHETTRTDADLDAVAEHLGREWRDSGVEFSLAGEGEIVSV